MKVSVIISTRNRPTMFFHRAWRSVHLQSFTDYEIIVIDDASDVEYAIPTGVRYYKNEKRMGLAYNRNLGVKLARGEYIVSLDDDNKFHEDFLEKTAAYLDAHPEVSAVGVGKNVIYPEGKTYQLSKLPCSINDGFLIRKSVFDKIKFDEDLHANDDAAFGLEFFKHFNMGLIDEPLMTVYGSPIFNTTSYSDYTDYHLDGLATYWLKYHDRKEYIGRMFMLASGKRWFRWLYWLETKLKRYYHIWSSLVRR